MASVFILTDKASGQIAIKQAFDTRDTATTYTNMQGITAITSIGELPIMVASDITEKIRQAALAKLTATEKAVLGPYRRRSSGAIPIVEFFLRQLQVLPSWAQTEKNPTKQLWKKDLHELTSLVR